jgi:hypothetical protein
MFKVHLQGRMGNQLFQYAFAYVTAKKNKTTFFLEMDRNKFYLKFFKLNFPYSLFSNNFLFRVYCQIAKRIKMKFVLDLSDCKKKIQLPDNFTNTLYKGYFQDASYFHPYKKDLLKLFSFKKKTKQLFEKTYGEIFRSNITLVVCIRTGIDYKNFQLPDYNYPHVYLPTDWFKNIIARIKSEYQKIIVISDEIKEAKLIFGEDNNFLFVDDSPEIQFQLLMNADTCVISNSSYAWWGAYLNAKPNKKVYAPKDWAGYNIGIEYPAGIMTEDFIWVQ